MSAEPIAGPGGPDDPADILRVLPARFHDQFIADYEHAVRGAQRPERYRDLTTVLRLWWLRALAYSEPGFSERRASARGGPDVPATEVFGQRPSQ